MNVIIVVGVVAGVIVCYFEFVDHWSHVKRVAQWFRRQLARLKPDPRPVLLEIPPGPPPTDMPVTTADGVTKRWVMHITYGANKLLAYEVTRNGFPGTQFLVERHRPDQQNPQYKLTPNRDEANAQWLKWREEWQAQPNGFAGASGTFDKLPW
jgi:hypothetical protein